MGHLLYNLIVMPIQMVVEITYLIMSRFLGNKGLAIIAVSIVIQTLILPLYKRSDALQDEEREKQKSMEHWVKHIKSAFKGDERFMMLQTYYRQQNYKTYYALKSSFSILLQIPFFIAAYHYLSNLQDIKNTAFGVIRDLGEPDHLLHVFGLQLNVLPIVMTLINIISGMIYTKGMTAKSKLQVYGLAIVFLVLLYNSPSGLVMYWTMNNIFSLLKNIFMKLLKHPTEVFSIGTIVLGVVMLIFIKKQGVSSQLRIMAILMLVLICQIPLIVKLFNKRMPETKQRLKVYVDGLNISKGMFGWEVIFLAILFGFLIPVSVISSSASEFVVDGMNPMHLVRNVFEIYIGIFVIWFSIFYMLMTDNTKKIFSIVLFGILGTLTVNYMAFGTHTGIMSALLVFEETMHFAKAEKLINLAVIFILFVALVTIGIKKSVLGKRMLQIVTLCMVVMCVMNVRTVKAEMQEYERNQGHLAGNEVFSLSQNGNNVIVFMLDRSINAYIPYIFEEFPELKETYAGFTYYPNTLSFAGFTNMATPALFGGYEYTPTEINKRADESLEEKQNEALSVMPVLFLENGFDVTVCDPPYAGYDWNSDLSIYDDYEGLNAYITEGAYMGRKLQFDVASNRAQQESNFQYYSLMKTMPLLVRPLFYRNGCYFGTASGDFANYQVSEAFTKYYTTLLSLEDMTKVTSDSANTFLMIQNCTTHEPVIMKTPEYIPSDGINVAEELAKQSSRVIDGKEMKLDNENQLAHYQSNVAALRAIGNWITYLKENDVYDNTRIILVADHGRGLGQFDYMYFDEDLDVQCYNPLLLVKDFGATEFCVSEEFMTNADVPTLVFRDLVDNPVNPFTGKRINSDEKYAHPQRITTSGMWSIEENCGNTFNTSDGEWYDVKDNIFNRANWLLVE